MSKTSWPKNIWIVVLLSTLKLLKKSDRSTENGITFADPVKNAGAFKITINITVFLMRSITLISFWTRKIYGTWSQHLLCHSTTLMIDLLCPISTLNQQLTKVEQTHIQSSLHWEGWTVKGRNARQLCILSTKVPTRRTSERNSCYVWRVDWSLETRSKGWNSAVSHQLYLYLSVAICFICMSFIACWCNICCFCFENLLFCSLSLMILNDKQKFIDNFSVK